MKFVSAAIATQQWIPNIPAAGIYLGHIYMRLPPQLATLRLFRAILANSYRASTIDAGSTSIIIFSNRSTGTMRSSCDLSPRHENMGALYNPVPQSRAATARTRGNWSRPSPCRIAYRTRIRVRSERIGKYAYDRRQNRSGKKYSILLILRMHFVSHARLARGACVCPA